MATNDRLTEKSVQRILAADRDLVKRHDVMIPNCFTSYDNEADMFCIRKSGLCDEIEIKVSRADFRIDEKKIVQIAESVSLSGRTKWSRIPKREALQAGNMSNYFWYCMPEGIVDPSEVPEWAGLLHIVNGRVKTIRSAKRLHGDKMSFEDRFKAARKLGYRYWNEVLA